MRASELITEMPFVSDIKRATTTGKKYYHGSSENLSVGTILTPGDDDYEDNWGSNLWFQALEYWRPNEYLPHKMSVFMVDNEDDIDNAGGGTDYIFTVRPIGDVQRHDMNWMSEIGGLLEDEGIDYGHDEIRELALNYWHGVPHTNESVWEYLAPEAVIVHSEPY